MARGETSTMDASVGVLSNLPPELHDLIAPALKSGGQSGIEIWPGFWFTRATRKPKAEPDPTAPDLIEFAAPYYTRSATAVTPIARARRPTARVARIPGGPAIPALDPRVVGAAAWGVYSPIDRTKACIVGHPRSNEPSIAAEGLRCVIV
jgi:hypothetical protein